MDVASQRGGVRSWSFGGLCTALFLGALNDNVFKLLLVFYISRVHGTQADPRVVATAGVVFVVPFLLLTPAAGVLADRFSRSRLVKLLKVAEIAIMAGGLAAFLAGSPLGLYATLFAMAAHSAFFGPCKYSLLPELVGEHELSRANAAVVFCTYIAVIAASGLAPWLAGSGAGAGVGASAQVWCVGFAVLGTLAALLIRRTPAAGTVRRPSWWVAGDVWRTFQSLRDRPYLRAAMIGSAAFSLIGAFVQANMLSYGCRHMGLTQEKSAYLFLFCAGGIAAGSWLAGRLSGRSIEFGIVPVGAMIIALAALILGFAPHGKWVVGAVLVLAGVGGALFLIPLDAFIQQDAPPACRAEVVAASSFVGWLGVLLAQGMVWGNYALGGSPADGFLILALLTLAGAVAALLILPDFLVRFAVLVVARLIYRVRAVGLENVPTRSGALLVCNHAAYVDAVLLIATQQRRLRFMMSREIHDNWRLLRPGFDLLRAIPIAADDPPRRLAAAIQAARAAIAEGYLVVIFAEGRFTLTGHLRGFRRGFEKVVQGTGAPIVPVYIGGSWGSPTSFYGGRLFARGWLGRRGPMTVLYGRPLPPDTPVYRVRQAVEALSCDWFDRRRAARRPLGERVLRALRRRRWRTVMSDTTGVRLSGNRAAAVTVLVAAHLRRLAPAGATLGIVLPPSVGGALANLAATVAGLVPVNLNFTASTDALRQAVTQSRMTHLLTARAFLARVPLPELPVTVFYLEDVLAAAGRGARLAAWARSMLLPAQVLVRRPSGFSGDSTAAILFSSGSTGQPKGVVLSHHNLQSNVESLFLVFHPSPDECLLSTLPLFHSFGFTAGLWYPLLAGLRVSHHANPLDASGVGAAARASRATVLFSTPTFLALYTRKVPPESFATLRLVVAGAERLRDDTAAAFHERFGVWPLQGYGATELSPVVALSLPDVVAAGRTEAGSKPGTVGLPLPGVALRIVNPDTGELLPPGMPGLLLVKGPNVMRGYLDRDDLTAAAMTDGWYRTGDIACVDEDGFLRITDRLVRFSKIGGEMVPHRALEDALQEALGAATPVVAVMAVDDARHGERLILLHAPEAGPVERLRALVKAAPLPNLWKPDADAYAAVDAIPLTATGKPDLARLRVLARQATASG